MAKNNTIHRCSECGWETPRWAGRCGRCQAWGSLSEVVTAPAGRTPRTRPTTTAQPITEVEARSARGVATGIGELDRVLGEGLVPGAVVLLGGEPGVGKSTLLLEAAARWAAAGRRTLYVTAEESAAQVRLRADRTGAVHPELYLAAESDLAVVLGHVEEVSPTLLVLDSVQTVSAGDVEGVPGGVTQVREVTTALVRVAKRRAMAVVIVGHVTKEGALAGPRTLEHLVDVVLSFEGESHGTFRMVRATKNRFGPADEVGCFEMTPDGIAEVPDPSGLFASPTHTPAVGTCVTVTLQGRRPLLTEVQALVVPSPLQSPRRVCHGVEPGRLAMTLAVLQRHAKVKLHTRDVYAATVGGGRVNDPAGDLATAVAVASAARDEPPVQRVAAFGEISLSGEVRPVPGLERRLDEAARLGVVLALVPLRSATRPAPPGLTVLGVETVADALAAVLGHDRAAVVPLGARKVAG
ncbi:DNA repair protein RadA [Propioniciclava sp.]|uniref:DNA repair protein RadA n=1 Tax=Propioniciclava sp. TaxID=2038686 RepID=UPI0026195533|nr:DNA repair protein RadA [Propioniciclava sp.]